jgi:hypothetical protein
MHDDERAQAPEALGHQPPDERSKAILWLFVVLGAILIVGQAVSWLTERTFARRGGEVQPETDDLRRFPAPRLEADAARTLADLRAREDELLNGIGWVDRPAGIVRIPIDRAMTLVLERGLPASQPTSRGK